MNREHLPRAASLSEYMEAYNPRPNSRDLMGVGVAQGWATAARAAPPHSLLVSYTAESLVGRSARLMPGVLRLS